MAWGPSPRTSMPRTPPILLVPLLLSAMTCVVAQSTVTIPAVCTTFPGNAAVSLPLRWTQGTMQVRIGASLLPAGLQGQSITGLRLRRPTFLFEPAYPGLVRTLTVRGGFHPDLPSQLSTNLVGNRQGAIVTLFGPAPVNVAPTALPGHAATIGQDVLQITFTQPLVVTTGSLFLEFEAGDAPFAVAATNWIDAVWFTNGVETGYVVTVGDGSCTTRTVPTQLTWNDTIGPQAGAVAKFSVDGAPPTNATSSGLVMMWMGIDPERPPDGTQLGFGVSLGPLDPSLGNCHQWAPLDVVWLGTTDVAGNYDPTFTLGNVPAGIRIGVQAAWLDPARTGLPLSMSNGLVMVLNNVGVGANCATAWFPGTVVTSPWAPSIGQMPVLTLTY